MRITFRPMALGYAAAKGLQPAAAVGLFNGILSGFTATSYASGNLLSSLLFHHYNDGDRGGSTSSTGGSGSADASSQRMAGLTQLFWCFEAFIVLSVAVALTLAPMGAAQAQPSHNVKFTGLTQNLQHDPAV